MAKVFISCSSSDNDFVEKELIPYLHGHDIGTWFFRENILPGRDWEQEIRRGLCSCDWFLVVLTPDSVAVTSRWVRFETQWGMRHRKARLVPLLLIPCDPEDLHIGLPGIQYVDFTGDHTDAFQKLISVLLAPGLPVALDDEREIICRIQDTQDAELVETLGHLEQLLMSNKE